MTAKKGSVTKATETNLPEVQLIRIVDSSCEECFSTDNVVDLFKQGGVKIGEDKTLEYTSSEADVLIKKYNIQKIPAIIVSKEILEYEAIKSVWDQLNATEKDGFFALHAVFPPYRDVSTNEIKGLVSLIMLNDSSCATCYDVNLHKLSLSRFGVKISSETVYDIFSSQGKQLLNKYNITKVPTILLSPDANIYTSFIPVWETVGVIDADGWFVFRSTDVMGIYKDQLTGKTVGG